jgi:hypothetical protein
MLLATATNKDPRANDTRFLGKSDRAKQSLIEECGWKGGDRGGCGLGNIIGDGSNRGIALIGNSLENQKACHVRKHQKMVEALEQRLCGDHL